MSEQVMKREYEAGELCWILIPTPSHKDKTRRVKAKVVHGFTLPDHMNKYFVCEVLEPGFSELVNRDATTMAATEDGFIHFSYKM